MHLFPLLLAAAALVQGAAALTYRGADISSVPVVEAAGHAYVDGGKKRALENILVSHSANTVRLRLWTAGQYNLNYTLAYAKRVKAAGLNFILDLHYSDTCACPPLCMHAVG
jgi:arabinogalactan endo-1,4-beta-galactosidase